MTFPIPKLEHGNLWFDMYITGHGAVISSLLYCCIHANKCCDSSCVFKGEHKWKTKLVLWDMNKEQLLTWSLVYVGFALAFIDNCGYQSALSWLEVTLGVLRPEVCLTSIGLCINIPFKRLPFKQTQQRKLTCRAEGWPHKWTICPRILVRRHCHYLNATQMLTLDCY